MRIVAISDLHLGVGQRRSATDPPEGFRHDEQLARFLAHLADGSKNPTALLLLGDIFELPGGFSRGGRRPGYLTVELADLLDRVDRIAAAHPAVFGALAAFVASGGTIHVVPGNHDPALAIPEVGDGLVLAIAAAGCAAQAVRDQLTIHPGAFHISGVLHAQHGNQLHDMNAFASPARPYDRIRRAGSFRLEDPLGSALHRLQLAPRSWRSLRTVLTELLYAVAAIPVLSFRSWRHATSNDEDPLAVALRPQHISGTLAAAWRVARRMLGRPFDGRIAAECTAADYMVHGARQINAAMKASNHGVPIYLFGHSHRAGCRTLGEDGSVYVNTGTWSEWAPLDSPGLPFVEITTGQEAPVVTIRYWDADQESVGVS